MKSFLLRAGQKIGHFFWSWGFLWFVVSVTALIVLFYAVEDWRGARAWAATKAEWEAKGESFDFNKFIPPPVPDEQNLGALPIFKLTKNADGQWGAFALRHATPSLGGLQRGELPDIKKIQAAIASEYATAFTNATPPKSTFDQLNALYPCLDELRTAAATRPLCRFESDYTILPPANRPLGVITSQLRVSKLLTLHAIVALNENHPDLALSDIKTNFQLLTGAMQDPTSVGGLVALGMAAIGETAIYDGLALHAWNDRQLAELESILGHVDFLADCQFAYRGETVYTVASCDYYIKQGDQSVPFEILAMLDENVPVLCNYPALWPAGWWQLNKVQFAHFHLSWINTVDPSQHRVFPDRNLALSNSVRIDQERWDAKAPWNIWFTLASDSMTEVTPKFAEGQVWVDEARIACALERYRLAHKNYPLSLFELVPDYAVQLPKDVFSGKPYRYRLNADGTFFLYSIGWNQIDDGGQAFYPKETPKHRDYHQGDWVWPTPENH